MQSEKSKKIGVKSASTNIPVVVHTSLTKRSKSSNQETLYRSPQRSISIPQDTLYKAPLVAQSPQRSESVPQETLTKAIPVRQVKPSKRRLTIGIKEREKIFGDLPPTRNVVKSIPAKRDIGRVAQPFVRKTALNRKNVVKAKPFNRRDSVSEETMKKILWGNGNKK